jgi:hypothetical protein
MTLFFGKVIDYKKNKNQWPEEAKESSSSQF